MHQAQAGLMKSADGSVAGGLVLLGEHEAQQKDMNEKITLDNGWPSHGRLLNNEATATKPR